MTIVLSVFVGISLGLLGGGGSILTVPLLAYVAGLDAGHAIAMSLLVVGVTSAVGTVTHARAGRVRWRTAVVFGLAAMVGAYSGGRLAHFVPGAALLIGFAAVMMAAGGAMLRGRAPGDDAATDGGPPSSVFRLVLLGMAVGTVSGLVGAGGGFLLVPALALVAGLPMPVAVGTSLVVISMQSMAGLAGHLATDQIDWRLGILVTVGAAVGALVGGRVVKYVDPKVLRRLFGWLVLAMASVILAEEVDPALGAATGILTAAAAIAAFVCSRLEHCALQRTVTRLRLGIS